MNSHNERFFSSTRHWQTEQVAIFLEAAANLLVELSGENEPVRQAHLVIDATPSLSPLVIWTDDNPREEIQQAVAAWIRQAPTKLLAAYASVCSALPLEHIDHLLQLLTDEGFSGGETLAFAIAERRLFPSDGAEDVGVTLTNLAGLQGGADAALAMTNLLDARGFHSMSFVETAARVVATRNPSQLAAALDAVASRWKAGAIDRENSRAFLADLAMRAGERVLMRALEQASIDPQGMMLRAAFGVPGDGSLFELTRLINPGSGETVGIGVQSVDFQYGGREPWLHSIVNAQERHVPARMFEPVSPLAGKFATNLNRSRQTFAVLH